MAFRPGFIDDIDMAKSGKEVPAKPHTVTIDGIPTRSLDLSEQNFEALVAPLLRALDEYGRPTPPDELPVVHRKHLGVRNGFEEDEGRHWCQFPGCMASSYSSRSGMLEHAGNTHGEEYRRSLLIRPARVSTATLDCRAPKCTKGGFRSESGRISHERNCVEYTAWQKGQPS